MERVASLRSAAKTQLDHLLDFSHLTVAGVGRTPIFLAIIPSFKLSQNRFSPLTPVSIFDFPLTTLGRRVERPHSLAYSSRELASGIIAEKVCVAYRDI